MSLWGAAGGGTDAQQGPRRERVGAWFNEAPGATRARDGVKHSALKLLLQPSTPAVHTRHLQPQ